MDYRNKTKKVDLFGNMNVSTLSQKRTKKLPVNMEGGGIYSFFDYYFWFLPKMRRFKRFEKSFNKTNKLLKKQYAAYESDTKKIKKFAEKKLDYLNNWLVACKVAAIIEEFNEGEIKDKEEGKTAKNKKSEKALKDRVNAMLKTMKFKRDEQLKKIKTLDNSVKKDAKEYDKMTNEFTKKIKKYDKSLVEHSKLVAFKEEVNLLNEKFKIYNESEKGGTKELRPRQREAIKKYNKRKASYDRVIAFTDGYMEKTTQFVNKLTSLRREGEFYNNVLINPKLSPTGKNKDNFESWQNKIQQFYRNLLVAYKSGGDYEKKFKEIKSKMANVGGRLSTIGSDKSTAKLKTISEIVKLLDQCIKHQGDINTLIAELRINFSNNQPAIRLQYDSQLILSKVILLRRFMDTIRGLMKKTFPKILSK